MWWSRADGWLHLGRLTRRHTSAVWTLRIRALPPPPPRRSETAASRQDRNKLRRNFNRFPAVAASRDYNIYVYDTYSVIQY